ncbi:MAG: T9SS type A sorting domain-containing protein [Bacteroidota bacterium]|nr:T9SS type A sorting domain-containing protein [Bacteroidota bacterium]
MKTKLLFLTALLFGGMNLFAQDLAPGINYSYNPPAANGIITSINVDCVENDGSSASFFDISMYLYDQATQTVYVIGTQSVSSISGYGMYSITNWNIDINDNPNVPAGTYRLGVWVDSGSDISESDENNNAGLLAGNINFTPSANGVETQSVLATSLNVFPNPANEQSTVNFTLEESSAVAVNIYDMTGKLIVVVADNQQMMAGVYALKVETASLPAGVYFVTITSGEVSVTRRLTVAH